MIREIGAVPYRIRDNQMEIVLITTRRRKRWIFPKGQVEKRLTSLKVAKLEAFEEAGIVGQIKKGMDREFTVYRGRRKVRLQVFPIECDEVLDHWPEAHERDRVVIQLEEALKMIKGKSLRKCIKRIVRDVA